MIVVPPFAEREQADPPDVAAALSGFESARPEARVVAEGVDRIGAVHPADDWQKKDERDGAPAEGRADEQNGGRLRDEPEADEPVIVSVAAQVPAVFAVSE